MGEWKKWILFPWEKIPHELQFLKLFEQRKFFEILFFVSLNELWPFKQPKTLIFLPKMAFQGQKVPFRRGGNPRGLCECGEWGVSPALYVMMSPLTRGCADAYRFNCVFVFVVGLRWRPFWPKLIGRSGTLRYVTFSFFGKCIGAQNRRELWCGAVPRTVLMRRTGVMTVVEQSKQIQSTVH